VTSPRDWWFKSRRNIIELLGMLLQTKAYLFWQKELLISQQHAKLFMRLDTTSQPALK
jgi:hypothetical protein